MVLGIFAKIAGLDDFAVSALVEPDDTVATLLNKMQQKLDYYEMPHNFLGAYSLVHIRPEGLKASDPDYHLLCSGDLATVAKYTTPGARLDITKTVRHYFGERVEPRSASIVLVWPPESLAFEKEERRRACIALAEQSAQAQARARAAQIGLYGQPLEQSRVMKTDKSDSMIPWQWMLSCLPTLGACVGGVPKTTDAKKCD